MEFYAFVSVGFGAWLRWWLGNMLNPIFPILPLGTPAANLLGGHYGVLNGTGLESPPVRFPRRRGATPQQS